MPAPNRHERDVLSRRDPEHASIAVYSTVHATVTALAQPDDD